MYSESDDHNRPNLPARMDIQQSPQEQSLLPRAPPRMDIDERDTSTKEHQQDCSCNYNRYATKKTIGHGLLEFALLTSNAMQLRTLLIQKQRDSIWIASVVLVSISILAQIFLAYILAVLAKGDIQDPHKQNKLEKRNNLALFITVLIAMINVIINGFMTSTNPTSFVDPALLQLATNQS